MLCVKTGIDTYDYLPGEVAYPFIHVGEQFEQMTVTNKTRLFGSTQITIHVWHNDWRQRGVLTKAMSDIEGELWSLKSVTGLSLFVRSVNKQVITDNSTNTALMHGIIEVDIDYQ